MNSGITIAQPTYTSLPDDEAGEIPAARRRSRLRPILPAQERSDVADDLQRSTIRLYMGQM